MNPTSPIVFSPFRLDLMDKRLRRGSQIVFLRRKTFNLLRYLVEHPGRLVTKAELFDAVWPNTSVSEGVLVVSIRELRKALHDDPKTPRFIETVHGWGYRFIAPVQPQASYLSDIRHPTP